LKAKFTKGGFVLTGGVFLENILRFIRNIILTRILAPEYFGLMATILAVIAAFQAFTEVGVRQAVIQNQKGSTPEFLNVAWWFSSIRGLLLFIVAFFTAPLVCNFYNAPELLIPLRVTYIIIILHGIESPRIHSLEKELSYTRWVMIKQTAAFLGVLSAIIFAYIYQNIWPLVIGFTTEFFLSTTLSFFIVPFKLSLKFDKESLRSLIIYAKGMLGLPIFTAVFQRIDIFAIGKLLTMAELGLYSIAQALAYAPNMIFAKIVRPLILPVFSKLQNDNQALNDSIIKFSRIIAKVTMPLIAYLIIFSKQILTLLYGAKYGEVWLPFSILMFYVETMFYSVIFMQLYFALGRPGLQRTFAIIRLIIGAVLIYPAIIWFGLSGAAFTMFISMFVLTIFQIGWTKKLINLAFLDFIRSLLPGLYLSLTVIIPSIAIKLFFEGSDMVELILGLLLCLIAWTIAFNEIISELFDINLISITKNQFKKLGSRINGN
jgi:O-antigen/teichoic acid export membrane protein